MVLDLLSVCVVHLTGNSISNVNVIMNKEVWLTSYAVDHEWVELFLAVFAHAWQVGARLHVTVKQVVQEGQTHLLCRPTVRRDVQHVTATATTVRCDVQHVTATDTTVKLMYNYICIQSAADTCKQEAALANTKRVNPWVRDRVKYSVCPQHITHLPNRLCSTLHFPWYRHQVDCRYGF